jgi:hypothetical protein
VRLLVLPVLAPALLEGFGLALLRKPGDKVGVAGGNALLSERLGHSGDELEKRPTCVDVACALAGLLDQSGNVIAGDVEQAVKALGLLVRVNIHALAVLDELPFERLSVVDLYDAGRNGKQIGKLRGAVTSGSCDNLEALCCWVVP